MSRSSCSPHQAKIKKPAVLAGLCVGYWDGLPDHSGLTAETKIRRCEPVLQDAQTDFTLIPDPLELVHLRINEGRAGRKENLVHNAHSLVMRGTMPACKGCRLHCVSSMAMRDQNRTKKTLVLPDEVWARIADYRVRPRGPSEAEAIRRLQADALQRAAKADRGGQGWPIIPTWQSLVPRAVGYGLRHARPPVGARRAAASSCSRGSTAIRSSLTALPRCPPASSPRRRPGR